MSEENTASTPSSAREETPAAPRVRRISNPRPKKTAAKVTESSEDVPVAAPAAEAPAPATSAPETPSDATVTDAQAAQDWPDAETVSDDPGKNGNDKRNKRRRRKGKGGQGQSPQANPADSHSEETVSLAGLEQPSPEAGEKPETPAPAPAPRPAQPQPQHQQPQRPQVNPEELVRKAWKIFLAEVSEEGVALISDQDARELSRRCFRLAEIFLDERGRRR